MKWDSPIVLALAGTLAIHLILGVVLDAIEVLNPLVLDPPPPHVTMVDVRVMPAVARREAPKEVAKAERPTKAVETVRRAQVATTKTAEPVIEKVNSEAPVASGGEQVYEMPDVAPSATGIPVKQGTETGTGAGSGSGSGSGSGAGSGSGSGTGPVSVATIKTMPKARGDYGYIAAYPAEARRLGIEGDLRVRVVVDAQGHVIKAVLLDSLGHGLDELALARAKVMEFDPAVDTSGRTVTAQLVWTFHMTLPK